MQDTDRFPSVTEHVTEKKGAVKTPGQSHQVSWASMKLFTGFTMLDRFSLTVNV